MLMPDYELDGFCRLNLYSLESESSKIQFWRPNCLSLEGTLFPLDVSTCTKCAGVNEGPMGQPLIKYY